MITHTHTGSRQARRAQSMKPLGTIPPHRPRWTAPGGPPPLRCSRLAPPGARPQLICSAEAEERTEMRNGRFIGRYVVRDAPQRMSDTQQPGIAKMATFYGGHVHAEHDGDEMHVFGSFSEMGQPSKRFGAEEGTSGIRSTAGDARSNAAPTHAESPAGPKTIADLQKIHDQYFAERRGRPVRVVAA